MHEEQIVDEFTHQAKSFATSRVAHDTVGELLAVADPTAEEYWLDSACGPGIVARALAPRVAEVHGIDATPAMIELARSEAVARGLANARFTVGDATSLKLPGGVLDGALCRFAIHHLPLPLRMVQEMARVVRPGGKVVLADHVADEDLDSFAWASEIERLRDPSHWATLTVRGLRSLGESAGLLLEAERTIAIELDLDDWLARGSGGVGARPLIERALETMPGGSKCFAIQVADGSRRLRLQMWLARWRRPA